MAHKKAGGSTRNGRDSNAQRLGVKRFGGQLVSAEVFSCGSAAQSFIPASMLRAARTIRSLRSSTASSNSSNSAKPGNESAY